MSHLDLLVLDLYEPLFVLVAHNNGLEEVHQVNGQLRKRQVFAVWRKANLDDNIEAFIHARVYEIEWIRLLVVGYDLDIEHNHVLILFLEAVDNQLVFTVGNAVEPLQELFEALHEVDDQLVELYVVLVVTEALEH